MFIQELIIRRCSSDIQVLTAYKKGDVGTLVINNAIQKVANPNYGSTDCMKVGDTVIVVTTQKGLDDIQDILAK